MKTMKFTAGNMRKVADEAYNEIVEKDKQKVREEISDSAKKGYVSLLYIKGEDILYKTACMMVEELKDAGFTVTKDAFEAITGFFGKIQGAEYIKIEW